MSNLKLGQTLAKKDEKDVTRYYWTIYDGKGELVQQEVTEDIYMSVKNYSYMTNLILWADRIKSQKLPETFSRLQEDLTKAKTVIKSAYVRQIVACAALDEKSFKVEGVDEPRARADCADALAFMRHFYTQANAMQCRAPTTAAELQKWQNLFLNQQEQEIKRKTLFMEERGGEL